LRSRNSPVAAEPKSGDIFIARHFAATNQSVYLSNLRIHDHFGVVVKQSHPDQIHRKIQRWGQFLEELIRYQIESRKGQ
jgi:hypothetical protein